MGAVKLFRWAESEAVAYTSSTEGFSGIDLRIERAAEVFQVPYSEASTHMYMSNLEEYRVMENDKSR